MRALPAIWTAVITFGLLGTIVVPLAGAAIITAHRGASHDAPENTLAAFRLAWAQGADAIEGDFYQTRDGHVVCVHDRTTKRTADRDLDVAQSTLAELRVLDVGGWKGAAWEGERIPLIREVLDTVPSPEKKVYLELKAGPAIVMPVKRALDASSLSPRQVVIISFDASTLRESKRLMPQVMTCWLSGYKQQADGTYTPAAEQIIRTVVDAGADGFGTSANPPVLTAGFIKTIRDGGVRDLHVWTVNDPELAAHFARLGVNGITTDRPVLIRERLRAIGTPVPDAR